MKPTIGSPWILSLALTLAAAGCSGEKADPCDGVQCGAHATCDSQSGSCGCDEGYTGDPATGCERQMLCTANRCSGHGVCRESGGTPTCTCELGYAGEWCDECDDGFVRAGAVCLPDPCTADTCNGHGACSADSAGKAVCGCSQGYTGARCDGCADGYVAISESPLECAANSCEPDPCNGHGTCSMSGTAASCACQTGWAIPFCDGCALDYAPENGSCINSKQVACADVAPAHATSTPKQVTVTYTTAGGWTKPEDCAWDCDANYALENGACINSKQVACVDAAPAHATSVAGSVTITYTDAGGWTQPAACAWNCATDWDKEGNACINSKQVACQNVAPTNATSVSANVTITYTTSGGWTAPAACAWNCNFNYAKEGITCINSKQVACNSSTTPANATPISAQVPITYTTNGGWTTPAACAWSCNADYAKEGSTCINSKQVPCNSSATPANATYTQANVTITYTTNGGWTAPAACAWACKTDYFKEGSTCINSKLVQCDSSSTPANATPVLGSVTITYTTNGGWTLPTACAWNCKTDYVWEGGACIHTKSVPCDSSSTPANADPISTSVTVTYSSSAAKWSDPAACLWSCKSGYDLIGGQCLNEQTVPCSTLSTPANATSVPSNVTITYSGTSWSAPAACAWNCNSGYHQVAQTCIEDLEIMWCSIQPTGLVPELSLMTGESGTLYGQVLALGPGTSDTINQSPLSGMLAKACTSTGAITSPVDVSALSCTPATFNVDVGDNDEYKASVSFATAGSYNAIFAFSGDEGASWTPCFIQSTGAAKPISVTGPSGTLFFSEYIEGSGNNKAVEIYNGTGAPRSMLGCTVKQYNGGSPTVTSSHILPDVTLAAGETYVLCNSSAVTTLKAKCDEPLATAVMQFNGDDALALECDGANADVIGKIGEDPGSEWGLSTSMASTADNTIRRKCSVTEGDPIGNDSFDPALEWDGFATDNIDGLGVHTCP